MRLGLVIGVVGALLARFAAAFAVPLVLALVDGNGREALGFAVGGVVTLGLGALAARARAKDPRFQRAEVLAVVSLVWLAVGVVGAIPFLFVRLAPLDALFESMSGITTTGASVFEDFTLYGRAIYLWRALLHWVGGLGVIALFVAILPRLGIAGRQLFFAEACSAAADEALAPQVRTLAGRLWLTYVILTAAEVVLLVAYGMPGFDAVCNAMATLSAGGFSPNATSIAGYANPACEWIVATFMLLAGMNFALQWRALTGRPGSLWRDVETRVYVAVAALGTLAIAFVLARGLPGGSHLRLAYFQTTSVMSATGFASADFDLWADGARVLLVGLMLFGGCAGSAAGGPKVVRWVVVGRHCGREMTRVLHPTAIVPVRIGPTIVSDDVLRSVVTFVVVYVATWFAVSLALVLCGVDLVTGPTAALACLANCGPGLGKAGPMANYAGFPEAAKAILVFAMWVGRLEVVTVLALLRPEVARSLRWRGDPRASRGNAAVPTPQLRRPPA